MSVFVLSGELNEIGADVCIAKNEVAGGWYFLIKNHEDDDWEDIVLTMNLKYRLRWSTLQVRQQKAFFHRLKIIGNKSRIRARDQALAHRVLGRDI